MVCIQCIKSSHLSIEEDSLGLRWVNIIQIISKLPHRTLTTKNSHILILHGISLANLLKKFARKDFFLPFCLKILIHR